MNDTSTSFILTPVPWSSVSGSLESVRLSSDVRERLILECFTNNGHAAV